MLRKSHYKGTNILDNSFKSRMDILSNPYEYNIESNLKDYINNDYMKLKSVSHSERNNKNSRFTS